MKHKHAELIHAWADGTKIQYRVALHDVDQEAWYDTENPNWNHWNYEFRKKPAEKVVRWQWVIIIPNHWSHNGKPELTHRFYKDETELCLDTGGIVEVVGKAEWSRMEFDK